MMQNANENAETNAAAESEAILSLSQTEQTGGPTGPLVPKRSWGQDFIKRCKKHASIAWFLIPAFVLAFVLGYVPMVGILVAFRDSFNLDRYGVIEAFSRGNWSFDAFAKLFSAGSDFGRAVKNTLLINVFKLIITFPMCILLAIGLSEIKSKFLSRLILIILCLPNFLSWATVIGTWNGILNEVDGALNNLLVRMGILDKPFWFMGDNAWFKPLVIFLATWKGIGWSSIIFYASIMSIDRSYYEAATLDGASKMQKIWYLTIPTIMPTVALMFVMNITYLMSAGFEQVKMMMTAKTQDEQDILDTYLYRISIQYSSDYPLAVALGVFNGLISLTLMLVGNFTVKKTMGRSLW